MPTSFQSSSRYRIVIALLLIFSVFITFRVMKLALFDRSFLQSQGDARSLRIVDMPSYRGTIVDRHNNALAVSTLVSAVWVSPQHFDLDAANLKGLGAILKIDEAKLRQKIKDSHHRAFLYLKRGVTPETKDKIASLNIPGVFFREEYKRFYPHGEAVSHLLGFTNIDDDGIEGLELAYNDWLKGIKGKKRVLKDRLGKIIEEVNIIRTPKEGRGLTLSIDRQIQYMTYHALKKRVEKFNAKSGSAVVLNPKTGEVLAMANVPSFNPNQRVAKRDGRYRNRAVTDVFEPGSVLKPFSIASALDSGSFKADSEIDTSPSWMMVDGNLIKDERQNGVLSITQVLQRSSNVGVTKIVLASPAFQLVNFLRRVGFGQATNSAFPGESFGRVEDKKESRLFDLATLGFGYGLSVTPLQLAHAYAVFANKGKLVPITLLKETKRKEGDQVLGADVAQDVLKMLEAVVNKKGTGRLAQIKGYRVAGKTGTSRIASDKGYEKSRHIASFAGIAPVSSPQLVVAVVINEPRAISYYGGKVAAPLFAKIMEGALALRGIPPDKVTKVE
jgi:cell division protein FtsI (penicillin-binding protein 3)